LEALDGDADLGGASHGGGEGVADGWAGGHELLDRGGGDNPAGGDLRLEVERGGAVLAGGHVGDGVDDPGTAHDGDLDGEAVGGGDLLGGDVEDPRTQVDAPQRGGPGPPAVGAGAEFAGESSVLEEDTALPLGDDEPASPLERVGGGRVEPVMGHERGMAHGI